MKHLVTVRDAVEMSELVSLDYNWGGATKHSVAEFSPDGKRFVVVVRKGNLQADTNDYRMLLFKTSEAFKSPAPHVLAYFSSSSNRPGIQEIRWLNDHKLAFLAENPGGEQQLYTVDCDTEELHRLTNQPAGVTKYEMTPDEEQVFFTAHPPVTTLLDKRNRRAGILVTTQPFTDLIGLNNQFSSGFQYGLFVKRKSQPVAVPIQVQGRIYGPDLWLSPDAEHLVVATSP